MTPVQVTGADCMLQDDVSTQSCWWSVRLVVETAITCLQQACLATLDAVLMSTDFPPNDCQDGPGVSVLAAGVSEYLNKTLVTLLQSTRETFSENGGHGFLAGSKYTHTVCDLFTEGGSGAWGYILQQNWFPKFFSHLIAE